MEFTFVHFVHASPALMHDAIINNFIYILDSNLAACIYHC